MSTKPRISLAPVYPAAGDSIARAAFASWIAAAGRMGGNASDAVARLYPDDPVAELLISRAAVTGATSTAPGWAAELANLAAKEFLAALTPEAAAATLISRGIQVSFERRGAREILIPSRPAGPVARPFVDEADEIPATALAFANVTIGPPGKMATITVMSRELAKYSAAEAIFRQALREDAAISLDSAYFSTAAGTTQHPAGLLFGVSRIAAAAGAGTAAELMATDMAKLAAAVGTGGGSGQVIYIAGPGRAGTMAALAPAMKAGTVLASLAVPADRLIAADPLSIVHGFGPDPDIAASAQTTLHMSDTPTAIGTAGAPNVVAAPTMSIFQTGAVALRMIMDVAFAKRRTGAAQYIDTITAW